MNSTGSTDGFALDVQGLEQLKRRSHQDASGGLKEASKQFEALFLQMMLKSMRGAIPKSEMSSDSQTEMYTEMLDQQWAQSLSGKGIGLAEQLTRQLSGHSAIYSDANTDIDAQAALFLDLPPSRPTGTTSPFANTAYQTQAFEAWKRREVSGAQNEQPEHVLAFVSRLNEPAQKAALSSGVPAELILAQAALETDWGRRQITTPNGADSHNLFGIKAGSQWQGATTQVMTTEYAEGEAQKQVERFRVYPTDEAAFNDYARLIRTRPGYAAVRNATDAPQAAIALQQGGYATDPRYAQKLISVMATIGPLRPVPTVAQLEK
ncbi:flagellar assembly peptidoglycan hydrolase FlgJ [Pseudomonas sp. MIL9]|uniref:flagellar assembly peptidoglycan hydrolase FlgJ n=1 Tax=Pseudomonas sp. MIL9 TaxID=2807620 RepID=UPI001029F547|nr:flagellar assembly peptidoglycan hydrolase FlgJ [Pseudomonas sp. MIL9]MBM6442987.1 flagellar assembly peptidoglycan hydrolase FlgJ [Pseudomonas sp. MIL9]RZO10909.1 flagellar assembly peptidoglycan hydrolase FlgJ [Pseudomonas moorei]